ncbi:hypothetical protein Tco_1474230 [Tanacetum coccineum]
MCTYLKNMEGYKLNDLKLKEFDSIQEMFEKAFKKVNTFKDFRTELVEGKKKRAGIELVQEITKKQKVEDDKETTKLKQRMEIIPDEEEVAIDAIPLVVKSPITTAAIENMLSVSKKLLLLMNISTAQDMDQDSIHMVAASKVPMLKPGEYEIWRMRIEQYIQMFTTASTKLLLLVNISTAQG